MGLRHLLVSISTSEFIQKAFKDVLVFGWC